MKTSDLLYLYRDYHDAAAGPLHKRGSIEVWRNAATGHAEPFVKIYQRPQPQPVEGRPVPHYAGVKGLAVVATAVLLAIWLLLRWGGGA